MPNEDVAEYRDDLENTLIHAHSLLRSAIDQPASARIGINLSGCRGYAISRKPAYLSKPPRNLSYDFVGRFRMRTPFRPRSIIQLVVIMAEFFKT